MKKFWSIFTVALVALSAVSCSNNFDEVATIEGETLSFNVNIDNTRTALEQVENVWKTVWVGNETLVVSDGEKSYNFTNTTEDKNKFSCEAVGIRSLIGKNVTVVYNSVINSAEGAAGMTLAGATSSFSETEAINMVAHNAFLKLTSEADVTLTASADIFGDGATRKNSIVVKGTDVLVPVYAGEVTLSATIAESKVKETTLTLADNKIYNLGTLEEAPATLTVSFNAVDSMMDPSMHGMPGIYLVNVANTTTNDFAMLLFYDNSNPFVALNGAYPVVAGSLGSTLESSCLLADPGYCQIILGGKTYIPVSGGIDVVTAMPSEDKNALVFNMVVADVENDKQYNLTGSMEENMIGAIGYGPSYIDFNITGWGFTTFEATYDENSANIIKLKSVSHNGEFVMELTTENGDITTGSYNVMSGTLSGYYFDGIDIREYVFDGGQIAFEKGATDNAYILNVSTHAGDWTMGGKYKVVAPENGYEITINFPVVEPVASEYGVVGSFQGWDVANPVAMVIEDGWSVARGVELYKDDEIKIVKGKTWDVSYGPKDAAQVLTVDTEHTLTKGGQNVKVAKNGKFDIYFNAETAKFKYTCVEEYTNLSVNITIDNKANWSPLYIILKDGETLLTAAEGDLVTDNKFAVSGDYIGSSLSYQFVSGDKKSDPAFVTISKNGAAVTLEENVIKLYFQLDTDNAKQWWGTTSKIHVWNTGTSFDTSWPGTTMTSEGNYTWSVVVPSELVGKTINYLIHNGNGWQSDDATVTIKAEGVTVVGSSINVK
ncbi:MAG: hypothetical protein J6K57_01495 [Alistipes sp.]|nr:hypothetical protein [Alistipes sp.]